LKKTLKNQGFFAFFPIFFSEIAKVNKKAEKIKREKGLRAFSAQKKRRRKVPFFLLVFELIILR